MKISIKLQVGDIMANVHTIYLVPSILAAKSLFLYQSTSFFHHLIFLAGATYSYFFHFFRTSSYFFVYISLLKIWLFVDKDFRGSDLLLSKAMSTVGNMTVCGCSWHWPGSMQIIEYIQSSYVIQRLHLVNWSTQVWFHFN